VLEALGVSLHVHVCCTSEPSRRSGSESRWAAAEAAEAAARRCQPKGGGVSLAPRQRQAQPRESAGNNANTP
jgi:hypothetical protein